MDELLTHLITKTRLDCEEAHRRLVFASTGLSGLHIIKKQVFLGDMFIMLFLISIYVTSLFASQLCAQSTQY